MAKNILVVAGITAMVWIIGLMKFAGLVPPSVQDTSTKTDAIVVLTGGSRRLGEGLELLSQGLAEKLFVSGVYRGIDVKKLLQIVKRSPPEQESRISIGNATNTTGNALETAAWMADKKIHSLRLVTAAYHMPRSLLEFRYVMPGAKLLPNPVFPENVKQDRWWAWPGTSALMISEYNKYLFAHARHWTELMAGEKPSGNLK
ncbi:MAG: YdcF family protein [Rhodospirillales bacterium]